MDLNISINCIKDFAHTQLELQMDSIIETVKSKVEVTAHTVRYHTKYEISK